MIFGQHDANTLAQFQDVQSRGRRAALMADGHLGYIMPIGGVVAYPNKVSVAGVGFDIACGNAAIRTDLSLASLPHATNAGSVEQLADEIANTISFGVGRVNNQDDAPVDDPLFEDPAWDAIPKHERDRLRAKARDQLGTVGSGNHYVDVFVDRAERIWVGVHFGSRGFGHTIASNFMALAKGLNWGDKPGHEVEALLDLDSPMGHDYWHLMNLAGRYAYAGREWVARKVVQILGGAERDLVHNHHNFAWKEHHLGEDLIVVRKGATPAFPGQRGFVGGSMGDDSVILEGAILPVTGDPKDDLQTRALYSTVHGAGRVMSRTEAAGKRHRHGKLAGQLKDPNKPGRVTPEMMQSWLAEKGVVLRGGGLDESPHAYRRLPDVLQDQGPTIKILEVLTPLIVVMAGANEFDPYKD